MNRGGVFPPVQPDRTGRQPFHPRGALAIQRTGPERVPVRPAPVGPRAGAAGVGLPGNYLSRSEGIRWHVWHR